MKFNFYAFFGQCIIFFSQSDSSTAKALLGHNVIQAAPGNYPFTVSIMSVNANFSRGAEHYCTGVLITRFDVLTSQHCVHTDRINSIQVVIGTVDIRNGELSYPYWWMTYDQWAVSFNFTIDYQTNDISNMRLLVQVPTNLRLAQITSLSNVELYGKTVVMAGWGMNSDGDYPDIMNFAQLKIMHNQICEQKLEKIVGERIQMEQNILCTFNSPYIILGDGDSGGPLLYRDKLIAINHGTCPGDEVPDRDAQMNLHICIHYYRDFIDFMKNC